jgi:hypothetical protein
MVFHRTGLCRFTTPSPADTERVSILKLPGLYIASTVSMETHVNYVLSFVSQRLYLINQFRKTGSSAKTRDFFFHSLTVSRPLHALPTFAVFL